MRCERLGMLNASCPSRVGWWARSCSARSAARRRQPSAAREAPGSTLQCAYLWRDVGRYRAISEILAESELESRCRPGLDALIVSAKLAGGRSFSEAARRLKIPVSSVSRRAPDLEEELGARLLERPRAACA